MTAGGALSAHEARLVTMCAALASRDERALRGEMERAMRDAVDPVEVEEALLQAYLFLGYPAALGALALWREVSGREADPPAPHDPEGWEERGEAVCRRVYAGQYDALRENVAELHPDLARWMVMEGYGKVLGRPGLELRVRELCILALLAVLDAPRQLHSHLRGALHTGASAEAVEAALELALVHAGEGARTRARERWREVRSRRAVAGATRPQED